MGLVSKMNKSKGKESPNLFKKISRVILPIAIGATMTVYGVMGFANYGHAKGVDCDDNNPDVHPRMEEICDGIDNNCNNKIDEGCGTCTDEDGDGYFAEPGCGPDKDYGPCKVDSYCSGNQICQKQCIDQCVLGFCEREEECINCAQDSWTCDECNPGYADSCDENGGTKRCVNPNTCVMAINIIGCDDGPCCVGDVEYKSCSRDTDGNSCGDGDVGTCSNVVCTMPIPDYD